MSVFGMDEQLRIEQQKTDTGVVSTVNGWMKNGLPTDEKKPKYNKDGKLVLDEQEIVCEDGRMVLEKCLQDEVVEVEDFGHLLVKPATKVQKKKEEPVVKQQEEVKPKGGGMKIIIKGPFKVKHAAPSFIKEKKTVQEAPPVKEVVEEAEEDSGVETTPTHQPKKHKLTLLSYVQEETLQWAIGSLRMPPYDIASWPHVDLDLHLATESVTRSEQAPQVSRAEEKVVRAPVEEVQGVAPNTAYSKPSYDTVRQDRYKALTDLVPSAQAVKLDTAEEKEVKTALDEVQGLVPNVVYSTPEEKVVRAPVEEVQGVAPNTTYSKPSYDTVRQDRYKALTDLVPSAQAVKLDTAEEKEVKTSLDEVQGLVPNIVYSTPCYHTVRQDRYKAFTHLVPSAEAPSIKLNKGKEQKAHLRLIMKGGDLAPINWHRAAVAAITQEYVRAKYGQVSSNHPIHIAKLQSAAFDLESIETHVDIAWNTQKPTSISHQYSKTKFSFMKSNSPVYIADTQTDETKLENWNVLSDLDWIKPDLIPVATHFYKTKSRFTVSQDPLYSGIVESIITVPQSVDDLAHTQKEKANVVDVSHKYDKAKSSQVLSSKPVRIAELQSRDVVAESIDGKVDELQYNKPEYEKMQQVVWNHNTNVVASTTAKQYLQGNQKSLHLAEDEADGIIEPVSARACKFETIPQPYEEALKYEITPSQQPTYLQAKQNHLILTTEVTKENKGRVEYDKAAVELAGQKLFGHNTEVAKSKWRYYGIKEGEMKLKTEVAKENTEQVEFHKPTVELTKQELFQHDTSITESGQPTYHEAKKNHLILTTEATKEITDRVEYDKAAVELTGQKLFRHNTSVTKSKWRYYGVREGRMTLQTEGVLGLDTPINYETATVRNVEQELHTANTEEVLVETADFFNRRPRRVAVPPIETLGVVEPLTYQAAIVHKVEQVYVKANQQEVTAEAPSYHEAEVKEVTGPKLEQGVTELDDLLYKAAGVEKVEAVYAKADQGEVTVEAPKFNTAITNSAFLTLSDTEDDVPEIKYDTVSLQATPTEPLHNVNVGEGKSECHLLHAEESEVDELKLEKTRKLKPPIIESAVREIVNQTEMTRPVFITNQTAVHAPLPTFTAKELNSLPAWETCQTFRVEEVTPLRAKPSIAVMNVCRAKASQPKVQLAEEVGIMQVDAVDCALSPPPKTRPGLFYLKPKEVQQPPLEEVGSINELNTESAKVNEIETPTLHKVKVTPVAELKLELPKLEIREETETITVDDLDLSPVTVVSPTKKQIHAKIELEEPTNVQSTMHVSLQALPRPLLKQGNEDVLDEVPLGSTLEIPEVAYHKARTSMCPLLTSHRAGTIKLPIQRAPPGFNKDWRTLKKLEGQRASLILNGETEAPYISRTSSVQSLSSQLSNDMWTYADDRKPTEKAEKIEPSPEASPEKLSSPPKLGSRKPLDDNTFKAPEETDAPAPIKEQPKAAPPKKGSAIQMVRDLLGLPTKGKPQPETKPPAPVVNETPPEPVIKKTPAPVVNKSPEPVVKETPAPVVNKAPEPVVKETPAPVVNEAPEPVVKEMPAPVVNKAPEPIVKETPAPVVSKAPEPVVKETPAPVVSKAPEPIVIKAPPSKLPEPDTDVPTTPIPSSMVVPSGPPKSPPAASSPQEKLGFWDSLMRREPNKSTAAAAVPDDSSTKPNVSDKEPAAEVSDADSPEDGKSNRTSRTGLSRFTGFFKRDSEKGKEEKKDEPSPKRTSLFNRAPVGSAEPQ